MNFKLLEEVYYEVTEQIENAHGRFQEEYPEDIHKQTEGMIRLLGGLIAHFQQTLPALDRQAVHTLVDSAFGVIEAEARGRMN